LLLLSMVNVVDAMS